MKKRFAPCLFLAGLFVAVPLSNAAPKSVPLAEVTKDLVKSKEYKIAGMGKSLGVPSYRMVFVIRSGVRATADNVDVKASAILSGVDESDLQEITDLAYLDFIEQLKAAGHKVLSTEELKATKGWSQLEFTDYPWAKKPWADARHFGVFAPSDLPLINMHFHIPISDKGPMGIGNWRALNQLSVDTKASLLIPTLVIDFSEMKGSGHKVYGTSASYKIKPGLRILSGLSHMGLFFAKIRIAGPNAIPPLKKTINIGQAGDLVEIYSKGNQEAVAMWNAQAATAPAWMRPDAYSETGYKYEVDPATYKEALLAGVKAFNRIYVESLPKPKKK